MRLESGNNYTISKLFCGDNDKIIIPDLQRDYCWGNPDNNLVKGFVEDLLEMSFEQPITMGLIYGYYDKFTDCHLQLCDGQQRLTTIFLIMGVLNRKLGFKEYNSLLMSSFELDSDDKEPYLQYAIRESSLYFLSDLTVNYFLTDGIESFEKIIDQPWFLNEFKVDPTVRSILNAIKTIEECLKDKSDIDLKALGEFIESKLEFLFYDMNNRENGEETFVIINTTGEPLSATQNLKPLIIDWNQKKYHDVAKSWEEMETWFWQNRNRQETEYPHTADEGMNCFLNVVRLLHCETEEESYKTIESEEKFPYKEIPFKEIYDDFTVYKRLYEMDFSERLDKYIRYPLKQKYYQQDRLYAILPTMRYCLRFNDAEDEDVKRIYHIFSNMARYRNPYRSENDGKLYSPVHRAIEMIGKMETKNIASLTNILANIENGEETNKIEFAELYKNSPKERKDVELLMAKAENHYIFNGRISVMIEWSRGDKKSFNKYYQKFVEYWGEDEHKDLDLLRRVLLTREMNNYPYQSNFGNKDNWMKIIQSNSNEILKFLEDNRTLEQMICDFKCTKSKWYPFIKEKTLMPFSLYKNAYVYGDVVINMKKERYTSDYIIVYKNIQYEKNIISANAGKWGGIWANEYCIWSDNSTYNLTLDYFLKPDGYQIVLWEGKHPNNTKYDKFDSLGLSKITEGDWAGRWTTEIITDVEEAKAKYIEIAKKVDDSTE